MLGLYDFGYLVSPRSYRKFYTVLNQSGSFSTLLMYFDSTVQVFTSFFLLYIPY